jgi:hypothetical protein
MRPSVAGTQDRQRWRWRWREREEKKERKEEEERARPNRYALKGASLGGALLSTVARAGLPHLQPSAPKRVTPPCAQDAIHLGTIQLDSDMKYVFLGFYL